MQMKQEAVIPAAGFGTRMLPAAKAVPKEMLPVLDRPTIQYVVEEAAAAGADDVLLVTSRDKSAIEDHFDRSPELEQRLAGGGGRRRCWRRWNALAAKVKVHSVRQPSQRGLGDAVNQARRHVGDEPFLCLLGDAVFSPPAHSQAPPGAIEAGRFAVLPEELKGRPVGRVLTKMGLVTREQVVQCAGPPEAARRQARGSDGRARARYTGAGRFSAGGAAQGNSPMPPGPALPRTRIVQANVAPAAPLPARQLVDAYREFGTSVIGLEEVPPEKVSRYGVVGGTPAARGRAAAGHAGREAVAAGRAQPARDRRALRAHAGDLRLPRRDAAGQGRRGAAHRRAAAAAAREPVHGVVLRRTAPRHRQPGRLAQDQPGVRLARHGDVGGAPPAARARCCATPEPTADSPLAPSPPRRSRKTISLAPRIDDPQTRIILVRLLNRILSRTEGGGSPSVLLFSRVPQQRRGQLR